MKIVIDIPKIYYERAKKPPIIGIYEEFIGKGIPLDNIRAEIADQRDFMLDCDGESDLGIALDIIDKYMESEDKE